jgi:type IV secretory pathway TrbD component
MSGGRHIEVPSPVVLRAVARPGVLLFATRDLTFLAGGAALLLAVLASDPILVIYCFIPFQALAIWQTSRDRYFVAVFKARFRCKGTRNLHKSSGHRYVP